MKLFYDLLYFVIITFILVGFGFFVLGALVVASTLTVIDFIVKKIKPIMK